MNKSVCFLILVMLVLNSCGKEDALTKSDLLTQSPWIMTASIFEPPLQTEDGSIVNWYAAMPDCIKDDIFYYYPSGVYTNSEGASRCSPSDAEIWEVGVWTFNEEETKLYKGIIDYINEYEILKLDGNELQLRYTFSDTLDNLYSNTETYNHPK